MKEVKKMEDKDKKNKYWMSLEQWREERSFKDLAQSEFVTPPFEPESGEWDRREFLKLMGASLALTSLSCLRRPAETIIPHVIRPEDQVPGVSNYYASSYYDGGEGFGLIVQTREGRPIKVDGHSKHPINRGGMSARAHAHLLELYDPERLKTPYRNLFNEKKTNKETIRASFDELDAEVVNQLQSGKTALLTDYFPSPASLDIIQDFSKAYEVSHFVWDTKGLGACAQAQKDSFQTSRMIPSYDLNQAEMIVSVHCDFLGTFLSPTEHLRKFSISRKPNKKMSRLVVFESLLSLTGTNADTRYVVRPSEGAMVLLTMIDEILSVTGRLPNVRKSLSSKRVSLKEEKAIRETARELLKHKGRGVVLADSSNEESYEVYVLANFINDLLENDRFVINDKNHYTAWSESKPSVDALVSQLESGKIKNVIIHRVNPLYSYPNIERLTQALRQAELVIYTGDRMDETAQLSHYIIPDHHDLEKWGVWEFQKGLYSIQQPTIRPLIESRTFEDSLIVWARFDSRGPNRLKNAHSWYEYLKKAMAQKGISWKHLLQHGFYQKQVHSVSKQSFDLSLLRKIKITKPSSLKDGKWELALYQTVGLREGRLANVSWLQEFPDPVTKICWDNYLCISPSDARSLSVSEGQVVQVQSTHIIEVPVHIQPGQSAGVLGLALGYGRKGAGEIANEVGVNAYPFLRDSSFVSLKITRKKLPLAVVQGHHSMEGRQIVVETTLQKYLKNPSSGIHRHKVFSLWSEHKYPNEKWGMVIDLNSCTGCGACVVACQSENNIPVVGKKYVLEGREMHWIRIDRYYNGEEDDLRSVVHQPVVCMHCDNAPCETVCPVSATVHSDQGTNDMIYNRCVGTRYCSNNCPYKVRRFNWFNYSDKHKGNLKGALNPDVTVRSRGVMEKCTFCIHRVRSKQLKARLDGKILKDGDIQTACQQSCPARAIVFGDLNDKTSQVHKAFEDKNAYSLLEELNTKPSVKYKTKIKNCDSDYLDRSSKGRS